jgi:hypothetical protein
MTIRAKELTAWAKVFDNGNIVCHNNYRREFEHMIATSERETAIAPVFEKLDEMDEWIDEHINSGKAAAYLRNYTMRHFNAAYAGKNASEIEAGVIEMIKEVKI